MLPRNVLIFHSAALGDFILSWPFALTLARIFPQSRIYYVTHPQKGELAERALRLEYSSADAGWHGLYTADAHLPEALAKLLSNAHTVVSFVASSGDTWAENVQRLAPRARLSLLDPKLPANHAGHISQWLLSQWADWPVARAGATQLLQSIAARGIGVRPNVNGAIVIHPGAGSAAKCWPAERFVSLAEKLSAAGKSVTIALGEVEIERWDQGTIARFEKAAPVRRLQSLRELYDLLMSSAGFVGNDSGPGHLAGILGLPTVCLFGPTDPVHWRPLGPDVRPLSWGSGELSADEVTSVMLDR